MVAPSGTLGKGWNKPINLLINFLNSSPAFITENKKILLFILVLSLLFLKRKKGLGIWGSLTPSLARGKLYSYKKINIWWDPDSPGLGKLYTTKPGKFRVNLDPIFPLPWGILSRTILCHFSGHFWGQRTLSRVTNVRCCFPLPARG